MKTLIAAAALLLSTTAHASVIYNWEGQCTVGCAGQAHAVLTLDGYTPGTPLIVALGDPSPHRVLSLVFSDNVTTISLGAGFNAGGNLDWNSQGNSVLPVSSGPGSLELWVSDQAFARRFH